MKTKFGEFEGQDVYKAVLEDGDVSVSLLNYGAVTQKWSALTNGVQRSFVLGFEKFEDYPEHSKSFGIIAGRVANRTAFGRFTLDGQTFQLPINNGVNHCHGGNRGFGRRIWNMEPDGSKAVRLNYHSPDGEEGYPGAIDVSIVVSLSNHAVTYDMTATPDRVTPVNLAQHSYYNLGGDNVLDHKLWLAASQYTPVDDGLIPTGEIVPVAGTHLDFTNTAGIGEIDPDRKGIDLNLVLDETRDTSQPAAIMSSPDGPTLKLWTDQPGIQVYNAPLMNVAVTGHEGKHYGHFAGLCLEPQKFPDALNKPHFPSMLCSPDQPYRQKLTVEIK